MPKTPSLSFLKKDIFYSTEGRFKIAEIGHTQY